MLAGVLLGRPTILLLDEPTNHLDLGGLRWLERFLGEFPGGVLVVSHDRRFLDNTVSRILELDGVTDELARYDGGYTAYRAEKQHRFERMSAEFRAQDAYRRRMEADIARAQVTGGLGRADGDPRRRCAAPPEDRQAVARKAKVRERRLERQMQQAEWIADPAKAPSFTLSLDGVSTRGRRVAAARRRRRSISAGGPSWTASTSRSRAASGSPSSARTARARRRSCGSSPARSRPGAAA